MNSPLQVPSIERTRHLLLDTDSRKLATEIRDLPYADIPSALLIAHRRLHTFNRFSLPPAKRLELLRPFHYAFVRFVEHYRRHFEGSAFARELSPHELDNLVDFLRELGFGFKHLIHDTLERNKRPNGMGLILFMALNYLHYYALFSYNRGRMLKSSFWQEVHYIYFTACSLQQHQTPLETPDGKQAMLENLYKQIVMLGLCSPFSLAPEEQWRAHDYLARFGHLVEIARLQDPADYMEGYSISPHCTQPALIPGGTSPQPDNLHLLNLAPFVDTLQRHLEAVKGGESLRGIGMEKQQRRLVVDLLMKLYNNWTRNPTRKSPRSEIHEQVGIVWGLDNICAMLDPMMRHNAMIRSRSAGSENRAWAHGDNESSNGMCLRLNSDDNHWPEAGQVIALIRQRGQQKTLEAGLVQWCAIDQDDQPYCGVESLRGNARKVAVTAEREDEHANERNGLLVVAKTADGRARSLLAVPNGTLRPGGRAQLISPHQAGAIQVEAYAVTHRTRQVEVFEIRVLH